MDPGAPIRLPGMRTGGPHLYWFQLLALFAMIKKLEQGVTSGVILAAVVGLGKTITMLAYILWVSIVSSFPWAMQPKIQTLDPWLHHPRLSLLITVQPRRPSILYYMF